MDDRSKVLKFRTFVWDSVPVREYKTGDVPYKGVTRQTLLGEAAGEEPFTFLTRYFQIEPGGHSTLERHEHPHAVVVIRGSGRVTLGERTFDIAPFDCVYVSPGVAHQFRATGEEPLGFLCTVDRVRDRPEVVS
jgi:mannose-6-phosphate isomerase-like protein (cupin superfamily)